jgi:hypothetical protein
VLDLRASIHHDAEAARIRDPGRVEVHDPELEPHASGPNRDRFLGVGDAQLGVPEDVDDIDGSGRLDGRRQGRVAPQPGDLGLAGVHRNHLVADGDEVPQDAVRGPRLVGGRPDDRDSPRRSKERLDPGVVEEGDLEAPFLEVQDVAKPSISGQVRASFAYGWPSAAGATERPMKPASTTIVTM